MSETFFVRRDEREGLTFEGKLLGHGSSHSPGAPRWFEVDIYQTDGGTFVVGGVGRSQVAGEKDRCWAATCETAAEVRQCLTRTDANDTPYLTKTALIALNEAATVNVEIRDVVYSHVA